MNVNRMIGQVLLLVLLSLGASGQTTFELVNKHTPVVDAPVVDAMGTPLAGTNFLAEL